MDIIIASKNVHKIREIKDILKCNKSLDIYSLLDFQNYKEPKYNDCSPEEYVKLLSTYTAKQLNKCVIADCSRLVIPALDYIPIMPEDFETDISESKQRKILIEKMKNVNKRYCNLECHIALSSPNCLEKYVLSTCEGQITKKELGGNGYGYDSIFIKSGYNKTFAQLPEETKNKISHRGNALQKILIKLESIK